MAPRARLRGALWVCTGVMFYLTFVWPFVHSNDLWFKRIAITAFVLFLASLAAILICKARRISS